jgi:hypothetical protein
MLHSLSDIAKDTIVRKNPFPQLVGFASNGDASHWSLTDLYPDNEKILRSAIETKQTFDTGWVGCKKEVRSFRIISDGNVLTIQAGASMDDFDNLIYDAAPVGTEFTEEQIKELYDYWNDCTDISCDTESEVTVPLTTYDDAMNIIEKLESENDSRLESWFEIVKSWVEEIVNRK